jgi:hypothetical protein
MSIPESKKIVAHVANLADKQKPAGNLDPFLLP